MRYIWIIALILAIITCCYLYYQVKILSRLNQVVVFFIRSTPTDFLLVPVIRTINESATPKIALELLLEGPTPEENLNPSVSPGTKLLDLKIENRLATVDFSSEIKTNFVGGSQLEAQLVEAIVRTLLQFDTIDRVEILMEGNRIESIAGHVAIDRYLP
ncbi:MAG: GerMN domain-containing protein [Firmicutes bacterium]|nr:GerMN domain-containing protein [Bacillota bacterium]